jgi:hypothetical protein
MVALWVLVDGLNDIGSGLKRHTVNSLSGSETSRQAKDGVSHAEASIETGWTDPERFPKEETLHRVIVGPLRVLDIWKADPAWWLVLNNICLLKKIYSRDGGFLPASHALQFVSVM